jgi:Fe-S-cluster containining protein
MAEYTATKKRKSGRITYRMDGEVIYKKDVPTAVLEALESTNSVTAPAVDIPVPPSVEVEEEAEEQEPPVDKSCIFCGTESKLTRMYQSKPVYLCDEHFHSTNLGQIAQHLREREAANAPA